MNIGIFTYGTRGDLQPYVALALGLMDKGHIVTISATEDFKDFVEGFGIPFQPLWGNAETMMNSAEGQAILKSENPLKLMKYYFKVLHDNRELIRKSYFEAIGKVDFLIANLMTLPIVSTIAEKQNKKLALTYFMPPIVPTKEFPLAEFDLLNFPWYNKLTYKIARAVFWKIVKKDTNEYRNQLGLPTLTENLTRHIDRQKIPDLYCISPSLIPKPVDWDSHHKITGFLTVPLRMRENHPMDKPSHELSEWLKHGSKPIYVGFGSNGVGNTEKFKTIISEILNNTGERILFCTGWSLFDNLPKHKNLFVIKYVNHESVFPQCKVGIFHGGAGTLASMLRNYLPVIIVSFYTDQPAWGKIIALKKLGIHIPAKKLTADRLITAIRNVQSEEIKNNALTIGQEIQSEKGLENAVKEIESYFSNRSS
jgi:UDP:flavonoid glycosyltransferase YjiC (YdhE family)